MLDETQGFNNSVEYQVPALALYDYVEKYGSKEKDKNGEDIIVGKIIITDDNNVDLGKNNAFTRKINYRREAARLYYDNEQSIKTILNNMTDSLMKSVIDNIIHPEFCINGDTLHIEKIDSILQSNKFKTKVKEKAIRDKIISSLTDALVQSYLSSIFDKIQSDKDDIIKKFFRESKSMPFSPIYYIKQRYVKKTDKNTESYLEKKVTQKNIDDYIEQQKNAYKK
jgi:hypothetical protein